jgi:hypothetical protein
MAKPHEYPAWRYHKDHEPVMLKSDHEYEKLPGEKHEWHDNLIDAGIKVEVYEGNGGHHRVRKVKGYVPSAHVEASEEKHEDRQGDVDPHPKEDLAEASEEKHEDRQGDVDPHPKEDLAEASEERLREILVSHGHKEAKLAKKSKEQLLKLFAE